MAGFLGSIAGIMVASQNSSFRLMGFRENQREVLAIKYRLDTEPPRSMKIETLQ